MAARAAAHQTADWVCASHLEAPGGARKPADRGQIGRISGTAAHPWGRPSGGI